MTNVGETDPLRLPWRWAVPAVLVLVATLVAGIVLYGQLPGRLPTHFGPNGRPDAWSDKSIGTAFTGVVAQALTLLVIGLAAAATLRRPGRGRTPRPSMAKALFVLAAGTQLTFLVASLAVWTVLPPGWYLIPLLLLPTALGLVAQIAESVHAGRVARAARAARAQRSRRAGSEARDTP